jgi:hypothetical protein
MINVSDKSYRENQNTHFIFNNLFFENRVVCEIMWKNILEPGRPQMTICHMRISRWVPNATNTLTICNDYCFPTETVVAKKRASKLRYTYFSCLVVR